MRNGLRVQMFLKWAISLLYCSPIFSLSILIFRDRGISWAAKNGKNVYHFYGCIKMSLFLEFVRWHFFSVDCLPSFKPKLNSEHTMTWVHCLCCLCTQIIWWHDHKISKWREKKTKMYYFYDQSNAHKTQDYETSTALHIFIKAFSLC